jgi:23S rRNA (adenine2503-C2)-methyltransferase
VLFRSGILDKIEKLVADQVTPNLALSLHAPNDRIRGQLVPGLKHRLSEIVRAGIEYRRATNKTVTFEYVLIDGVNDDCKHALELGKKLRGTHAKVNVIPLNAVEELPYRCPSTETVDRFVKTLGACGVPITVRKRKGDAISAACGQLRHRAERENDTSVAVGGEPIRIPSSALPALRSLSKGTVSEATAKEGPKGRP